eukprot:gene17383-23686_t
MLLTRKATAPVRSCSRAGGAKVPTLARRSVFSVRAQATKPDVAESPLGGADRRAVLMGFAALGLLGQADDAQAIIQAGKKEGYNKFIGLASPPSIYGGSSTGYESPKYTFEYPKEGWKVATISKVEKGMQGIDSRVENKSIKSQSAFVVTLGRAGEDGKNFVLRDLESTFAGFAGADYNLQGCARPDYNWQDSLIEAIDITTSNFTDETTGDIFYVYDIDSLAFHYLASIAVKNGVVFALFVRSPAKDFKANEENLRYILSTFALL